MEGGFDSDGIARAAGIRSDSAGECFGKCSAACAVFGGSSEVKRIELASANEIYGNASLREAEGKRIANLRVKEKIHEGERCDDGDAVFLQWGK